MKVLVTGFYPFGKYDINSSWEIAKAISCEEFPNIDLQVVQLPVSFRQVKTSIDRLISTHQPDIMIMMGQSSKSEEIRLERIAVNMMDATMPDNDGFIPDEETIVPDGLPAYFCNIPLKMLKNKLVEEGFPVCISNSAGMYVCNTTYYYAMYRNEMSGNKMSVLFIHLPLIKDNSMQSSGLPLELMKQTVVRIVESII